jgi:ABC-type lipoprotein export system ATPase subunit
MATKLGLEVKNLCYAIGKTSILQGFSLRVPQGDACLILGPSGSGKTTLLSILAGLQSPDSGTVCYDGASLYDLSESERDQFRGQRIGILFQTFHLIKPLTVRQNLLLAYSMPGKTPDAAHVEAVLERLGLKEKAGQNAGTLSVGEAQRLALARAIVGKPTWLLCDEPTSSLDDHNAEAMMRLLKHEAKQVGTSLIVVTHDRRVRQHIKGHVVELGGRS